jgi:diguanylate cyclase (GGDEF)-like protein
MTNTIDLENKVTMLREDYKNKLPNKIDEISNIWKKLTEKSDSELLSLFHNKVHSLHGTADTFGFMELGKTAVLLENVAKSLVENPELIPKISTNVDQLLNALKELVVREERNPQIIQKIEVATNQALMIYLLDDMNWENNLASQMTTFGYQVQRFDDVELLVEQLNKQYPAVLIININLVNDQLQNMLIAKNEKSDSIVPIIFLSTSGEFSLRLKAARLGGEAYLIKPFLIDDLISRIDFFLKSETEPYRILIIDDEIDVASYNAAILEQANMKTCIITKSNEVDRALHEFNPDLILIDLFMPDCNGLELATIIRQQNIFQSTPIIYLSAEEDQLKQLNAMKLGADDFLTKSTKSTYLIMTIRNRVERYKKLRSLMVTDNLTGLYNHSFIQNQLEIELKESMSLHNPLSIALIDLDKFKSINDTYGHQAGDHVLRSLGLVIRKRLHVNDIVGRYGGEKFLVILPNTSLESAKTIIDELRKHFLTLNYSWNQQVFNASFSAGIASFPDFHTASELIEAASESMAKSKQAGRNCVETAE